MQVDGAVVAHVFLHGGVIGPSLVASRGGKGVGREDSFVIHNGQLVAEPSPTRRSLLGIASRSLAAAARMAVIGDLFRIFSFAMHVEASYQWVTIPEGVDPEGAEFLDPEKMSELYQGGYRLALEGPVWRTRPPGEGIIP